MDVIWNRKIDNTRNGPRGIWGNRRDHDAESHSEHSCRDCKISSGGGEISMECGRFTKWHLTQRSQRAAQIAIARQPPKQDSGSQPYQRGYRTFFTESHRVALGVKTSFPWSMPCRCTSTAHIANIRRFFPQP